MKSLIFSVLFIAIAAIGQAQKITQLEEAEVSYAPLKSKIVKDGNSYSYLVNEDYDGEFTKDPIAFMQANFNIQTFITEVAAENYDSYHVVFKSSKGHLKADYDKKGELLKTSQRFKNIVLPLDVRRELYMANKGWSMISNKYMAFGKGAILNKEIYKIKLEKDGKSKKTKLDGRTTGRSSMASTY